MITEFSLDKDFFSSQVLNDQGVSAVHDFLTEAWVELGVLVLPKGGADDFLGMINCLPSKFRQRWLDAFEYGRRVEVDREWWNFGEYDSFESLCDLNGCFKTAFAEDAVSYVLTNDESNKGYCEGLRFEVLGAGVCTESVNICSSKMLSVLEIVEGDVPGDVWASRFESLARYSKKITIIDRYFFESIWRAAQANRIDGALLNFFSFLSGFGALGKKFNIKIVSHGGDRNSDFNCAVSSVFFRSIVSVPAYAAVIESLTLVSAKEDFFRREAHDRFIGFDRHVCQIGNGMRVLGDPPLPRSTFLAKFDRRGELAQRESSAGRAVNKLWSETF